MRIVVSIPDHLPNAVLQPLIRQFEMTLQEEARKWRQAQPPQSKWARIAQEAHEESPLNGLSDYILSCSHDS